MIFNLIFFSLFSLIAYFYSNIDTFFKREGVIVANLINKTGDVHTRHQDLSIWNEAFEQQSLYQDEIITTGPFSIAIIEFNDERQLRIEENSQVILKTQQKKDKQNIIINLQKGTIFAKVDKLKKPDKEIFIESKEKVISLNQNDTQIKLKKDIRSTDAKIEVLKGELKLVKKAPPPPKKPKKKQKSPEEIAAIKNKQAAEKFLSKFTDSKYLTLEPKNGSTYWILNRKTSSRKLEFILKHNINLKNIKDINFILKAQAKNTKSIQKISKRNKNSIYDLINIENFLNNNAQQITFQIGAYFNKNKRIFWNKHKIRIFTKKFSHFFKKNNLYIDFINSYNKPIQANQWYLNSKTPKGKSKIAISLSKGSDLIKIIPTLNGSPFFRIREISTDKAGIQLLKNGDIIAKLSPPNSNLNTIKFWKKNLKAELAFRGSVKDYISLSEYNQQLIKKLEQNIYILHKNQLITIKSDLLKQSPAAFKLSKEGSSAVFTKKVRFFQ